MGNLIGYARVSTLDQNLHAQTDALTGGGAVRIFTDKLSGATTARPQLQACLDYLNPGDVLLVYSTDRLSRSVSDLISTVTGLRERGIEFRSLTEPFDTTSPGGELSSIWWPRSLRCNANRSLRKRKLDSSLPLRGGDVEAGPQ